MPRPATLRVAGAHEEPVRPGIKARWVAELRQVLPDAQQRLLGRILGQVEVAQDPPGDSQEPVCDLGGDEGVRPLVTALSLDHEIRIHVSPHDGTGSVRCLTGYGPIEWLELSIFGKGGICRLPTFTPMLQSWATDATITTPMTYELSPSEAAARIGTTTRSVQRWIAAGRLPARRVGGRWRVASVALDAFLAAGEADSGSATSDATPIGTLFIANRGEIVARIARTCERLGIRAVAPPTEGAASLDLLDIEAVVAAAVSADVDAVHPGFGFLAENADFADAVLAAGIRWVGPPPAAIRTMGDKAAARALAADLEIPVLPGYDGADQSDVALATAADRIGYPIVIKPSAGGGGKGMHVVHDPARLIEALAAARREAQAAFGDGRLILERLAEGARHVEVQVLFDTHGNGIHLGERDCSLQRRHQKILEETPSPAVTPRLRGRLTDAALTLAREVGYVSAGTCEFLITDRGEPAFLEMNTRLQVEHPVTEAVTGRDLVADQLRIAAGEALGVTQRDIETNGHAVEVRLYAEDAEDGFLPATGRIEALRWPADDAIRVDAGIALGTEIGARFDPMLAKIVAHGRDRAEAFARLTCALDETLVLGVITNLRFLRWLVRQPVVLDGEIRTDTLDRVWPPDDWAERATVPADAWRTAAAALGSSGDTSLADPWTEGWRLNAGATLRLQAGDATRSVTIAPPHEPRESVVVDEVAHVDIAGRSVAFRLAAPPDVDRAARAAVGHAGHGGSADVIAPMPGSVLAVHVAVDAARHGRRPGRDARSDEDGARRRRAVRRCRVGHRSPPGGPGDPRPDARHHRVLTERFGYAPHRSNRRIQWPTRRRHPLPCPARAMSCWPSIARRDDGATPRRTAARSTRPPSS